ncbi:MAG TPA: TetR/AcrR family transcriptional regulator [Erysipelotrichaceae bacterium]|nr:TetR/AcrR family transcriptional regulator [Erysipelotrichaceae bacterium]
MEKSTKELISEAAIDLFNEHGFEEVSVNEIIDVVGVSKRTFYYHFKSKEEILEEFYKMPAEITVSMLAIMLGKKSNVDKLLALYRPRIEHFTKVGHNISRQIIISNLQDNKGTFRHTKQVREKIRDIEVDLIKKAQEANEITNQGDAGNLSDILIKNMMGHIIMCVIEESDIDNLIPKIEKDAKIILGVKV